MPAICENKLHTAQKRLHKIIRDMEAMRVECCNTLYVENRRGTLIDAVVTVNIIQAQ